MALAVAIAAVSLTAGYVPRPPKFSWDTLPVFFHGSNASGPFTDEAIKEIARFPMVTIEKFQGPCGHSRNASPACHEEELIIAEIRKVKAINPNISTVFYYNSVLDFPQYDVHQIMLDDPTLMLHDAKGAVVRTHCPSPVGTCDVFDFGNPKARELFISVCVNATQTGLVDGCFIDRAVDNQNFMNTLDTTTAQKYTAGRTQMLKDLQAMVGEGPIIGNHAFGPPHDNISAHTGINFCMIEGFHNDATNMGYLRTAVANGRGVQAHAETANEDTIAAFLIGAGYHSFFGMGGWSDGNPTGHWSPYFSLPLGDPLDTAVNINGIWTRRFKHVNVTFDEATGKGKIDGWTFPPGPSPPPPPGPPPKPTAECPSVTRVCGWQHADIKSTVASSWQECCGVCGNVTTCSKWVFHALQHQCRLHSSAANKATTGEGDTVCGTTHDG